MKKFVSREEAESLLAWTEPRTDSPDDAVVRAFRTIIRLYDQAALRKKAKSEPSVESLQQRILKLEKLLEEACETIEDTEAIPSAHAARIRRLAGFPPV